MDVLKILKSLEEFIYEAASWLFFFPRTLVAVFSHPIVMAGYADVEVRQAPEQQFRRYLSPPLFLLLAVAMCHGFELYSPVEVARGNTALSSLLLSSEEGLLAYRTVSFAIWALCGALYSLRRTGTAIDRDTLRGPFYAQCYIAAPTAIFVSLGGTLQRINSHRAQAAGAVLVCLSIAFYVGAQSGWLRHKFAMSWARAGVVSTGLAFSGLAINVGLALLLVAVN